MLHFLVDVLGKMGNEAKMMQEVETTTGRLTRRTSRLRLVALVMGLAVGALVCWTGCSSRSYELHGQMFDPPRPAADFALVSEGGRTIRLSDFRGQVVLLYFGYTFCPDVCPTTVAEVGRVFKQLGDDAHKAQFIMITVDPQRDTAEKLAAYVSHFDPSFLGLTGTPQEIKAVADNYAVFYEAEEYDSGAGYLVSHTTSLMLIDPEGMWRGVYAFGTPAEEIVPDVRHLIDK